MHASPSSVKVPGPNAAAAARSNGRTTKLSGDLCSRKTHASWSILVETIAPSFAVLTPIAIRPAPPVSECRSVCVCVTFVTCEVRVCGPRCHKRVVVIHIPCVLTERHQLKPYLRCFRPSQPPALTPKPPPGSRNSSCKSPHLVTDGSHGAPLETSNASHPGVSGHKPLCTRLQLVSQTAAVGKRCLSRVM